MDHLPWPEQHPLRCPKVPYLCAGREQILCNDIESFVKWPELRDWNLDPTINFLESATIFQAWIQFGLLRFLVEATNRTFDLKKFIIEEDGQQYVTLMRIQDVIQLQDVGVLGITTRLKTGYYRSHWMESAENAEHYTSLWLKLTEVFRQHSSWMMQTIQHWEARSEYCDPWRTEIFNVFWSTLLLLEQISDRREDKIQSIHNRRPEIDGLFKHIPSLPQKSLCINNGLKLLGRCPSLPKRTNLSSLDAFRLYTIPLSGGIKHEHCQVRACKAFNIDTSTYKTRHIDKCSTLWCHKQRVSLTAIEDLIERDAIPIVSSTLTSDGHVAIEIIDTAEGVDFTAISHVWAGGLGNFKENSLFQCQLDQIHTDLVHADLPPRSSMFSSKSQETVHYWLDTLCIPILDQRLKKKAIDTMASIYAKAESVLVVDPELRLIESQQLPKQDIGLALLCSPWMARSWTLQEGALAVDLQLKFADRVVPFSTINSFIEVSRISMIQGLWSRSVDRIGTADTQQQIRKWAAAMGSPFVISNDLPPLQSHESFIDTWNELSRRSSTKADDLVAILAVLLGQSAGEVLQLPKNKQMQALLGAQTSLPLSLLFAPQADNSASWCPAFPTCQQTNSELSTHLGAMKVIAGGELQIVEGMCVRILQCDRMIPLVGEIRIHDSLRENTYHVTFKRESSRSPPSSSRDVIFIVPETDASRRDTEKQLGLCFLWHQDDNENWKWKFVKGFEWIICEARGRLAGSDNLLEDDSNADYQGHTSSWSASTFPVANPFSPLEISPNNPLILDIGIDEWPKLSWSRPDYYPFIQASLQMAQALNFLLPLAMVGSIYFGFCLTIRAMNAYLIRRSIGMCIFYYVCYFVVKGGQDILAQFEHLYYRGLINEHLQSIWAKSFSSTTPERQYTTPRRRPNKTWMTIGLVQLFLLVVSAAVTISLFIAFSRRASPEWSPGLILLFLLGDTESNAIFNVAKRIFICIFLDLCARLIALICFDPLGLWKKQEPLASQEREGSRYAWIVTSLQVFLPILGVPAWVICIRFWIDLRPATHGDYRAEIFIVVPLTALLGFFTLVAIRYLYFPIIICATAFVWRLPGTILPRAFDVAKQWWLGRSDRTIQLTDNIQVELATLSS